LLLVREIVKFPVLPGGIVRLYWFELIENPGDVPGTLTPRYWVACRRPLIPVTPTEMKVPGVALGATNIVSRVLTDPPIGTKRLVWLSEIAAGPYEESVSPTVPLKPEILFRVT
jgi:hypothetical protein